MSLIKKLKKINPVVAIVIVFVAGFLAGSLKLPAVVKKSVPVNASSTVSSTVVLKTESGQNLDVDFSLFWDAVKIVKSRYVHSKDVTDKQLLYGAIKGAVDALDDPFSVFF